VTVRGRVGVLLTCVVVAMVVALYAALRSPPPAPLPPAGSVHLGPEPGQDVAGYLASLPATRPPAGVVAPALVQFGPEQTPTAALAAVAGATPVTAVFRVEIPRVQTALRFEALEPGVPAATALDNARQRAAAAASTDAGRLTGRPQAVAAAEARDLAVAQCGCVLALVVDGDGAVLGQVADRAGVRALDAAPPGTTPRELALSPLLPGQTGRADPLPDDGVVAGS